MTTPASNTTNEDDDCSVADLGASFYHRNYKGFIPRVNPTSYDSGDLSDVSVPDDDDGRDRVLADLSPAARYERNQRNIEMSISIEDWSDYLEFERKIAMDEIVRRMKGDRVLQLRQRVHDENMTESEKTEFWRLHYQCVLEQGLKEFAARKKNLHPTKKMAYGHLKDT